MKVLIAADKLKGTLAADEAVRAIASGVRRARPDAELDLCPLADGGEGTLDVLVAALGGEIRTSTVSGPRGAPRRARWAMNGTHAILESAEAAGLDLLEPSERDPGGTTSFGVGELIVHALDAGAARIWVALGGSATNDGGAGLGQALGARFDGAPRPITGGDLESLGTVDRRALDPRLGNVEILALADVDNPLLGAHGATRVYAAQKGASAERIAELERGLARLASHVPDVDPALPRAGAAGGMGFGLVAFAGAKLASGAETVLAATRFDERLALADLVITAEGRLDAQSLCGKVVIAVARRARRRGVPVIALAGAIADELEIAGDASLSAWFSLSERYGAERAQAAASELLAELAGEVVRAL